MAKRFTSVLPAPICNCGPMRKGSAPGLPRNGSCCLENRWPVDIFMTLSLIQHAGALQAILNEGRSRAVEVVDLARIDLGMKALMDLFHDSITLQPDAVVIFAGNNWHPSQFLNATDQEQMQEMELADRPLYRRRKFLESRLANEVQSVLGELGNVAKGARVPVIFVLPENNHLDWQFNSGRAPSLAPAGLAKWLALREQLKRSFEQGDADGAHRVAEAMTGLDGQAHAFASQMQARLCLQRGLLNEARSHLARARDADIIAAQAGTPRCYSIIQRTVRQHAEANGLVLVDLPSGTRSFERRTSREEACFTITAT